MNICVFCSSSNALDSKFFKEAIDLGTLLSEHKHNLVYGGANVGLMNEIAETMLKHGSHITGVIPEVINNKGLAFKDAHELIITKDLSERKMKMMNLSDAFIALPGGFGTLEEILEVVTLKQLQVHNKPIIFLNTDNFYSKLFSFFETIYDNYFAKKEYKSYYYLAETPDEIVEYLNNYSPPDFKDKWYNVRSEEFRK